MKAALAVFLAAALFLAAVLLGLVRVASSGPAPRVIELQGAASATAAAPSSVPAPVASSVPASEPVSAPASRQADPVEKPIPKFATGTASPPGPAASSEFDNRLKKTSRNALSSASTGGKSSSTTASIAMSC